MIPSTYRTRTLFDRRTHSTIEERLALKSKPFFLFVVEARDRVSGFIDNLALGWEVMCSAREQNKVRARNFRSQQAAPVGAYSHIILTMYN